MKANTLIEIGKGFINIGNGIIILTIINGLFNLKSDSPLPFVLGIIITTIFYISGSILINKGSKNE